MYIIFFLKLNSFFGELCGPWASSKMRVKIESSLYLHYKDIIQNLKFIVVTQVLCFLKCLLEMI